MEQPVISPCEHDEKTRATKAEVLTRYDRSATYNSLSKVATFVGTMFTTAGVTMGLGAIAGTAAIAATTPVILGVLAIGALFLGGAVVADKIASHIYQGANFDNLEANANSTARHLVSELKTNSMCLTNENDSPCHQQEQQDQSNKKWASQIEARRTATIQEEIYAGHGGR